MGDYTHGMAFWKRKPTPQPDPAPASKPASATAQAMSSARARANEASSASSFLMGSTAQDRRSVEVLLGAIAKVSESRDLESLLDYVVDSAIEITGAERGLLVLLGESGRQEIRVARERGKQAAEAGVKYSTSVVRRVLEEQVPMRTTVQSDAEALELGASVFDLKLRAVMCAPLVPEIQEGDSHPTVMQQGTLYVDSKAATREFSDEDLALFHALAQHIAIALENANLGVQAVERARLERSLEIASEIQAGLMPQKAPDMPGFDVFGWFRPADHATGDFYDFVRTRDKRLAVVVGDVTGHGIGPALITATAQSGLRSYVKVLPDPGSMVGMLNEDLSERMDDGMFLTLFLALITEEGEVSLVNAGHTPPLIWRAATGEIETVKGTGPALGMMADFEYGSGDSLTLEPGDMLVACTDGLEEARNPERPDDLYGEKGIRGVLVEIAGSGGSAQELCETLVKRVLAFTGGVREDDMTVVAVRREA
ncbi:MAG: serine phosphatase RsbU (regulator of sigma subunit) [Planctomycetota bacterium]